MAKRTASEELRATSAELNAIKDREKYLTSVIKKAKVEREGLQKVALEILDIVNLERRVEGLLNEQIRLEEQQRRWESFDTHSVNITKIVNALRAIGKEIERTDLEIIRRAGVIINQVGKTNYVVFKTMLIEAKLTRQQILRMTHMLA